MLSTIIFWNSLLSVLNPAKYTHGEKFDDKLVIISYF